MDVIDRYLESVRWFLPSEGRDDILAELRDVLMTRREEQAATLGRPLTRAEDEALLRDFGNPIGVAARYGRQRYLVGPGVYPVFALVLRIVLAVIAASAVVSAIAVTVVGRGDAGHGLALGLAVAWNGAFVSIGIVTVIFAALERSGAFARMAETWRVRDLPRSPILPRSRMRRQTWVDWVSAVVGQSLFILWWVGLIHFWPSDLPAKTGVMHFAIAPQLAGLYWAVLGLSAGVIVVNLAKLAGHGRRPAATGLDLALSVAALAVALLALHAGAWIAVTGVGVSPSELASARLGVNIGARVTLIVLACGGAIGAALSVWRLLRQTGTTSIAANGA